MLYLCEWWKWSQSEGSICFYCECIGCSCTVLAHRASGDNQPEEVYVKIERATKIVVGRWIVVHGQETVINVM